MIDDILVELIMDHNNDACDNPEYNEIITSESSERLLSLSKYLGFCNESDLCVEGFIEVINDKEICTNSFSVRGASLYIDRLRHKKRLGVKVYDHTSEVFFKKITLSDVKTASAYCYYRRHIDWLIEDEVKRKYKCYINDELWTTEAVSFEHAFGYFKDLFLNSHPEDNYSLSEGSCCFLHIANDAFLTRVITFPIYLSKYMYYTS